MLVVIQPTCGTCSSRLVPADPRCLTPSLERPLDLPNKTGNNGALQRGEGMSRLDRRQLLTVGSLATGGLLLPRLAIGQADNRPVISIAVQQIATSANLETVRERSN